MGFGTRTYKQEEFWGFLGTVQSRFDGGHLHIGILQLVQQPKTRGIRENP